MTISSFASLEPDIPLTETGFAPVPVPGGGAAAAAGRDDALQPGTRLNEFQLIRVLGAGGFGIVYLALDRALLRYVAIKEYMPAELARRQGSSQVSVRSAAHAATFAEGLQSFLKEARLLASFDHPSLVKVLRFWEGNGTAYMAMQYYAGRTLQAERRTMNGQPDEAWLRRLLDPILGALEVLHAQGVYHRDISPDNILLLPDGSPVLLDFGAARRVLADRRQNLTTVFKPNFSPLEQCGDFPTMKQGPWTDIYALAAVIHFMLTAKPPLPAVVRAVHDHMPALSVPDAPVTGLSAAFLGAIDWALGVRPHERPQHVQALRDALDGLVAPPPLAARLRAPEQQEPCAEPAADAATDWPATVCTPPPPALPPARTAEPPRTQAVGDARPEAGIRRRGAWTALGVATLCATGFGAWALNAHFARIEAAPVDAISAPAPAPAPSPALGPASAVALPAPTIEAAGHPSAIAAAIAAEPAGRSIQAAAVASAVPAAARSRRDEPAARKPVVLPDEPPLSVAPRASAPRPARSKETEPAIGSAAPASRTNPQLVCGDRNFLSMAVCMTRVCREPRFQQQPQCLEFMRFEEERQRQAMSR